MGRNKRPKAGAKSERAKRKLKGKLPPFFAFYFFIFFFFLFFLFSFVWEEKDAKEMRLKHKGRSERAKLGAKSEGIMGAWRKALSLLCIFFFFIFYFILFFAWEEEDAKRKCLNWNRRAKVGTKSEKAECKFEGKLPPFSAFIFFSMVFFSLFLFFFPFVWKEKDVMKKCLK